MLHTSLPNENDLVSPEAESVARYIYSMEHRIKSLETQVARLIGSNPSHVNPTTSPVSSFRRTTTSSSSVLGVIRLTQEEFDSPDKDLLSIHALELLVDNGVVRRIRIRSEQLLKTFRDILGQDLGPDTTKSAVMTRPFKAIMTCAERLKQEKQSAGDESAQTGTDARTDLREYKNTDEPTPENQYIDLLFEALSSYLSDDYSSYVTLKSRLAKTVSFQHFWYLFQPGDVVVERSGSLIQAYRIRSVRQGLQSSRNSATGNTLDPKDTGFFLDCFSFGCDGKTIGPVQKGFTITHFLGIKEISKLPIVPIEYLGREEVQDRLTLRGKTFCSLTMPSHKCYKGKTLDLIAEEVSSQVIVDFELYYRQNPAKAPKIGLVEPVAENDTEVFTPAPRECFIYGCKCSDSMQNSDVYDDRKVDKFLFDEFLKAHPEILEVFECVGNTDRDMLPGSQLLLLPSLVWAFDLRGRKWHPLDIDLMCSINYSENAFQYLVLPSTHKMLLRSLAKNHGSRTLTGSLSTVDTIAEKGKGLCILLHGPPGVGKTSTAECLADYAKRPLLPITAADLGANAQEVQRNLETFFALSSRWGCILLLDEADILLAARDRSDMQRNATVSVFLRILEYYSGILVLTTNRVGTFDEAFKSRIHVVLYFPPLSRESSLKVWEIALERASTEKGIEIKIPSIMPFLKHYWDEQEITKRPNGRVICNSVQSAVALAEKEYMDDEDRKDDKVKLSRKHLRVIFDMSNSFDQYLNSLYGVSEDSRASMNEYRNDDDWEKPKYVSRAARKPLYTTSRQSERLGEARYDHRPTRQSERLPAVATDFDSGTESDE